MTFAWDPSTVLNFYPENHRFTCIGITKKGTRCGQCMFSKADLSTASYLLDTIALLPPLSSRVRNVLPDLAFLGLCPRWHRKPGYSQVAEVVQRWQSLIVGYCDRIAAEERRLLLETSPSRSRPARNRLIAPSIAGNVAVERTPLSSFTRPTIQDGGDNWPIPIQRRLLPQGVRPTNVTVSSAPPASNEPSSFPLDAIVPAAPPRLPRLNTSSSESQLWTPPSTPQQRRVVSVAATTSTSTTYRTVNHTHTHSPSQPNPESSSRIINPPSPAITPAPSSSTPSTAVTPATSPLTPSTASTNSPQHSNPESSSRAARPAAPVITPVASPSTPSIVSSTTSTSISAQPTTPAPTAAPAPTTPPQCPTPHRTPRRRPITEHCGVCLEPICCPDEAVWCRAQCGQNIHRQCFGAWRRQALRGVIDHNTVVVSCVFCRARWRWEWED